MGSPLLRGGPEGGEGVPMPRVLGWGTAMPGTLWRAAHGGRQHKTTKHTPGGVPLGAADPSRITPAFAANGCSFHPKSAPLPFLAVPNVDTTLNGKHCPASLVSKHQEFEEEIVNCGGDEVYCFELSGNATTPSNGRQTSRNLQGRGVVPEACGLVVAHESPLVGPRALPTPSPGAFSCGAVTAERQST